MDDFTKYVTAGTGLVVAVMGAKPFWDWRRAKMRQRSRDRSEKKARAEEVKEHRTYLEQMTYLKRIARKMEAIRKLESVTRVIIFIGHNGGGLPRVNSRYYTTAVHWDVEVEFESSVREYKNIEVDVSYIEMLLESYERGFVAMKTKTMPESKLRRYYESEGVVDSMVFYMDMTENNFIYMSISSHEPGGIAPKDKGDLELMAYSAKSIVKQSVQSLK